MEIIDALKILNPREVEIMEYVNKGYTNKEISNILFVSENTIKKHRQNVCKKLKIKGSRGLIKWCRINFADISL